MHPLKRWMIPAVIVRLVLCCECVVYCVLKEVGCITLIRAEIVSRGMCMDIREEYGGVGVGAIKRDRGAKAKKVRCYHVCCCCENFYDIGCECQGRW